MAVGFLGWFSKSPRRDQIVVVDMGFRTTKAVYLRQDDEENLTVAGLVALDAPPLEKRRDRDVWAEHFKAIAKALDAKTNRVILVLGPEEGRVYQAALPAIGVSNLRRNLRSNSRSYLNEDLPAHTFDCIVLPSIRRRKPVDPAALPDPNAPKPPGDGSGDTDFRLAGDTDTTFQTQAQMQAQGQGQGSGGPASPPQPLPSVPNRRRRTLVGAARTDVVADLRTAATLAGWVVDKIGFGQVSLAGSMLTNRPVPGSEAVMLLDIGFKTSSICVIIDGVPALTRVVGIGGDRLSTGLAETLNITYSVAEGIKQVMPEKVESKLQGLLSPLSQELRASIDFVEHMYDRRVSEVLVSGGSARSQLLIHLLEREAIVPCKAWDPLQRLAREVPESATELATKASSQFAVAVGAGLAWLGGHPLQLNLLAEELEEVESRRRDPFRRGMVVSAVILLAMLVWVGVLGARFWRMDADVNDQLAVLRGLEKKSSEVTRFSRQAAQLDKTLRNLQILCTNRFQWAPVLNALQFCMVDNIQLTRLKLERTVVVTPGTKTTTNANNRITLGKPDSAVDRMTMTIQAKDYGSPPAAESFIETLATHGYFATNLRRREKIRLVERSPRHVDPLDPERTFILFSIECYYAERQSRDN